MRDNLEKILIGAIFEETESRERFILESFHSSFRLLMECGNGLFEDIPKSISVSNSLFEETEKKSGSPTGLFKDLASDHGKLNEDGIELFETKGILIHNGIYGSAFGRMSYIYRSKGMRIYLFEDGELKVFCTYCTIDHHGFNFANEEVDSNKIENVKTIDDVLDLLQYTFKEEENRGNINCSIKLLRILSTLNSEFIKDYFIEYL